MRHHEGTQHEAMPDLIDFGAEDLIALYVALCADLGVCREQAKMAAIELIDMAMDGDTLH